VESSSGGQGGSSLNDQLIQAAEKGDTAAVQQLLDKGANIEPRKKTQHALIDAAAMGNRGCEAAAGEGATSKPKRHGRTALM